ncbi:MFS transporter [Nesterenkonia muleiensis]|uniref:MFS transporter n=1 Tax=Nesterenkonia muleiensis TaxID=2282648 RepID=UPI0013003D27|nr:MFS transporter [Nesterenkonia muleiensis]
MLVASTVLTQSTVFLVRPTTTYKLLSFNADGMTVGLIAGLYALFPLLLAMPIALRAQRTGTLIYLLVAGVATLIIGAATIALAPSTLWVGVGSAILGLGQITFVVSGQAAVGRFAEDPALDTSFGWFTAGISSGQMIGPLVGGLLIQERAGGGSTSAELRSVEQTLWVGAALSMCVIVLLLFFRRSFRQEKNGLTDDSGNSDREDPVPAPQNEDPKPSALKIIRIPRVKSHFFAAIVLVATVEVLSAYLPLVGEEHGISPTWIGALLAMRAAASLVSRMTLPLMRRRFSRHHLLLVSLFVAGLGLSLAVAFINVLAFSVPMFIVAGFCMGVGVPLTMSVIAQTVPQQWRSSALALSLAGNRFGQLAIPLVAGTVTGVVGAGAAIWLSCALLLSSGAEKLLRSRSTGPD